MSLLFDQNLSRRLPALLADAFPSSRQVIELGLSDADDQVVWSYAAANGLAIVSKDKDFLALALARGAPPKVIWLRVGNGPTRSIELLLRARRDEIMTFLADPAVGVLILP